MKPASNPFAAPEVETQLSPADESLRRFVTSRGKTTLRQVRPWVWVIGLFFSLVALGTIAHTLQLMQNEDLWIWTSVVNRLAGATVYLVPGLLLVRYGWRLGDYLKQANGQTLLAALDAQRHFFLTLAVLSLCWMTLLIAIYVLVFSGVSQYV